MVRSAEPLWKQLKRRRLSAAQLLAYFDVTTPPVDIDGLARQMGARVLRTTRASDWAGALDSTDGEAVIWVKRGDPPVRQRFTVAHEIGHLMLHPDGVLYRDVTFAGSRKESAANGYAAKLLMPDNMMRAMLRRGITGVDELARRFEVSRTAMEYRLDNLGF